MSGCQPGFAFFRERVTATRLSSVPTGVKVQSGSAIRVVWRDAISRDHFCGCRQ